MKLEDIENAIKETEKSINKLEKIHRSRPKGTLSYTTTKGRYYYSIYDEKSSSEKPKRKYLHVSEIGKAKAIAQRDYNEKLLKSLYKKLKSLYQLKNNWFDIQEYYTSLSQARKNLITPLNTPDEVFIAKWESEESSSMPNYNKKGELFTNKGDQVRSKSEVIIANALFGANIPYKYEYPLTLGQATYFPDFTILNVKTREEIIWEHLGMVDSPEYVAAFMNKLRAYESNGYILGKNLLVTVEDSKHPLSILTVKRLIKEHLQ